MKKINVFLDDLRPCPEGFILARDVKECIKLLENNEVKVLSLDHDLGYNLKTGYDLVKYMVEKDLYPEVIYLHTANPVGRQNMYQLLERYKPDCVELHYGPMPHNY